MKIKTITCHDVYNLGASLQAYALQNYLLSLGHDVEIIHYKPDYLSNHHKLWLVANPKFNIPFIKQLYLLAKLPGRLIALKRKKVFDKFTLKYLRLTRRYNSYEELKKDAPKADCYIAGSDQIWNTLFRNGRDAAFYLDFGNQNTKRISYAASFATPEIVPEYRKFVEEKLKRIDYISIRERISLPLLESLGRKDGVAVCDPVFLLNKKEWESHIDNSIIKQKYILVYLTNTSDSIKNITKAIAEKTGWKIYTVGAISASYADKNYTNASPFDFIHLIRDAQFIISNSFHATAFSIIFDKNFCVVNREDNINERMLSILKDFGLTDRLVTKYDNDILNDIDYSLIVTKKESIINFSKEWLNNSIDQ